MEIPLPPKKNKIKWELTMQSLLSPSTAPTVVVLKSLPV